MNKNTVAKINHNEYNDVLLDNKCLRHSINKIWIKNHRIGTYKINKVSLSYFEGKIYIPNNRYDGFALGYQSYL